MVGVMITDGGAEFDPPPATGEVVLRSTVGELAAASLDRPASDRALIAAGVETRGTGGDTQSARARARKGVIPGNSHPTQREVAALFNVSTATLLAARQVLERGAPELIDAVRKGEVPIYTGSRLLTRLTHAEQANFVANVRRGHRPRPLAMQAFGGRSTDPNATARRERYEKKRRAVKTTPTSAAHLSAAEIDGLRYALDALAKIERDSDGLDPSITSEQAAQLLDGLSKGRGALRRVVRLLTQRKESTT